MHGVVFDIFGWSSQIGTVKGGLQSGDSRQAIAECLDEFNRQVDEVLIQRRSLRGNFCDDEFVRPVDKDVLTVNTQPQCNVSISENVPLVAIMHWTITEIGNQV